MITFDIETTGKEISALQEIFPPFEPEAPPGEFDPNAVKIGNLKDPAKVAEKIEAARKAHEAACRLSADAQLDAELKYWEEISDKASLDAVTGYILAIGYYIPDSDKVILDIADEASMLDRFWRKAKACRNEHQPLVGVNIHDFDLPFIMRRSWILGVNVPQWVIRSNRWFDDVFVDLRKVWLCGQYAANCKSSFTHLSHAFTTDGKPEGVTGADFATLLRDDREKAEEYLRQDVIQPAKWAQAMGIR